MQWNWISPSENMIIILLFNGKLSTSMHTHIDVMSASYLLWKRSPSIFQSFANWVCSFSLSLDDVSCADVTSSVKTLMRFFLLIKIDVESSSSSDKIYLLWCSSRSIDWTKPNRQTLTSLFPQVKAFSEIVKICRESCRLKDIFNRRKNARTNRLWTQFAK